MHDKNGVPIEVGDEVTIRGVVERTTRIDDEDLVIIDGRQYSANTVEKVNGGSKDVQEAAERGAGVRKGGD